MGLHTHTHKTRKEIVSVFRFVIQEERGWKKKPSKRSFIYIWNALMCAYQRDMTVMCAHTHIQLRCMIISMKIVFFFCCCSAVFLIQFCLFVIEMFSSFNFFSPHLDCVKISQLFFHHYNSADFSLSLHFYFLLTLKTIIQRLTVDNFHWENSTKWHGIFHWFRMSVAVFMNGMLSQLNDIVDLEHCEWNQRQTNKQKKWNEEEENYNCSK